MLEDFDPFKDVALCYTPRLLNTETARPVFQHAYHHLEVWAGNGACKPGYANWDNLERDVRALCDAFPVLAELVDPKVLDLAAPSAVVKGS
jgi:hypothetical protein